ncbi:transposase, IS605 OrfB family, central region [Rubidibacter lacunae KORDI 51-2]|uniref:Transposase, IS605 OrfB family, central region n=1 Tax=Rubidibacter lacunae KORDI 51-2 TaxID=582515 RepID=U5DEQ9_9CHRO|nr:RNA-guided endonuclease TnpB family protein [Rubidibacter lacunae]ERN39777.1 transposase, IS605 OrfB family, central region [Rubidibacter lacunae KORDI 51-2]
MELLLTLVCKLDPTPEQSAKLDRSLQAFAAACNYVHAAVDPRVVNKVRIQAQVYHTIRACFGLNANLAVRVCARVAANRKTARDRGHRVKTFRPTSADYDQRIFAFREVDNRVSLSTVEGRERIVLAPMGDYQRDRLRGRNPTSAQLCQHRDGLFYIHIQVKSDAPAPHRSRDVLGVDLGRADIAVTPAGESWSGQEIRAKRDRFNRTRASLQRKGTKGAKGAKRLLKRLSGAEKRYQRWLNHHISKQIVETAKSSGVAVALEDLKGIRDRTNRQRRTKTERRRANSWAFYQLRQFVAYKALGAGVEVVCVNPRYSSQTCHQCLHIHPERSQSYRSGKRYECGHCGWKGNADYNGAQMIRLLGVALVSPPERARLSCSLHVNSSVVRKLPA